jgi:hypothetical protein
VKSRETSLATCSGSVLSRGRANSGHFTRSRIPYDDRDRTGLPRSPQYTIYVAAFCAIELHHTVAQVSPLFPYTIMFTHLSNAVLTPAASAALPYGS